MNVIVVLLLVLAAGAIIIGGLHFFFSSNDEETIVTKPTCDTCNGDDSRCEQECRYISKVNTMIKRSKR